MANLHSQEPVVFRPPYQGEFFKATPHKERLTALQRIYLHIFRHLAHKFFDIRQYACKISAQSAEKSDSVSAPQSLCGVALKILEGRQPVGGFLPCHRQNYA